ncbi:MAG: VanW family protein [Eubacterium sp.]|nr:VanW family protein [Eubacterium sp.]
MKRNSRKNNKGKKTRIIAVIIVIVIIAVMVLSLVVSAVRAEEIGMNAGNVQNGTEQPVNTADNGQSGAEQSGSGQNGAGQEDSAQNDPAVSSGITGTDSDTPIRVCIAGIDVTGMTESEMQAAVDAYMGNLKTDRISLCADTESMEVTAGDLGLTYTNESVVEEALSIGKKGNVLKRFLAEQEVRQNGPITLDLDLSVDNGRVTQIVNEAKERMDCDPAGNSIVLNDDATFSILPIRDGISINAAESVKIVENYMNTQWFGGDGSVMLDAVITAGEDTSEMLSNIRNLLGESTTQFDAEDTGRTTNITTAAQHIDGTVLYPGEIFSTLLTIGPTTEENGFALGTSYAGSEIVKSYGGGVCQVSTTLYNAVLKSELDVIERHNHSMRVHYVDPGFDAAISDDSEAGAVDFSFVNAFDAPVYIQAEVGYGTVTFRIYGKENRSKDRTIEFQNKITSTTDFGRAYTVDSEQDYGTIYEMAGEEGLTAELWKIIYIDGVEDHKEQVNTSIYSPTNHTYFVGTKGATPETESAIRSACATKSIDKINAAILSGAISDAQTLEEEAAEEALLEEELAEEELLEDAYADYTAAEENWAAENSMW